MNSIPTTAEFNSAVSFLGLAAEKLPSLPWGSGEEPQETGVLICSSPYPPSRTDTPTIANTTTINFIALRFAELR